MVIIKRGEVLNSLNLPTLTSLRHLTFRHLKCKAVPNIVELNNEKHHGG